MTAFELKTELDQRAEEATALCQLWACSIGTPPELIQFHLWVKSFGFGNTRAAIERTSTKFIRLQGVMDSLYQRKYCTSVAKRLLEEQVQQQ